MNRPSSINPKKGWTETPEHRAQPTGTVLADPAHETGAALASDDQFKTEILRMGLGGEP
jgi:hypothetical protein